MKVDEVRERYLAFFERKNHKRLMSDSLVPANDPTLLFTGAGMNQFKDNFLGVKKDLKRATTSQKCLRTGDLDQVGKTACHHSFFEMLGNFSFGDYFKREAITWAWEFLTEELRIPKDKLRISVHKNDEEAFQIWRDEIKITEAWIYKLGDKGNFWPANAPKDGPNGPCGPCSEIYFDQGTTNCKNPAACTIECDCGRFTEIWNLVFTQFDRQNDGSLQPLAQKNIDTGMGLERLACVLQGKKTNFEIDSFQKINAAVENALAIQVKPEDRMSLYAISDHLRAATFAIADGVIPSNEGRGYVIRKLIRRAVWQGKELRPEKVLTEPFLCQAVKTVGEVMKKAYPEILQATDSIATTLRSEEDRFLNTLDTGLGMLTQHLARLKKEKTKTLPGKILFELYDTYGFPEEMTRRIAERDGFSVDTQGFEICMEEQRRRAKESTQIASAIFVTTELEKTIANLTATRFLGYETLTSQAKVLFIETKGSQGILITDQTPFYAESGGQVGDQGLVKGEHFQAQIIDVQKKDKCFIHSLDDIQGKLTIGDRVTLDVDARRRFNTMRNHTATHLLHAALRKLLGTQVRQLGSLVSPEKLRFDYSYGSALSQEELQAIEDRVNQEIWANSLVSKIEKPIEEARQDGAIAFFGEKYGDRVRVVSVESFSKEFCGGTHCDRTGQIGFFVIIAETSIASGTRRIEARTGEAAMDYMRSLRSQILEIAEKLRVGPADIAPRISKLQDSVKRLEKEKASAVSREVSPQKVLEHATIAAGSVKAAAHLEKDLPIEALRALADSLKGSSSETVYLLASSEGEKLQCILGMSADLKATSLDLRDIWKIVGPLLGASGGGRKDLIQAGGRTPERLEEKWSEVASALVRSLSQNYKG